MIPQIPLVINLVIQQKMVFDAPNVNCSQYYSLGEITAIRQCCAYEEVLFLTKASHMTQLDSNWLFSLQYQPVETISEFVIEVFPMECHIIHKKTTQSCKAGIAC